MDEATTVPEELRPDVARLREVSRQTVRRLGMIAGRWPCTGHTHTQCHALLELDRRGALAPAELAEVLELDRSTVSRLAASLVEHGWVETRANPRDGRSKALALTAAGRGEVARIDRAADAQVSDALALLAPEERGTVVEGMALYARALGRARNLREIEVRPIEPRDSAQMGAIIRKVMTEFGAVGCGFSIEDAEVSDMYAAYQGSDRAFFVALRGDELLGGAGVAPLQGGGAGVCELRKMYLLSAARGLGVGRRLLERCLAAARELGFATCYLETLAHMTQARHLYEKQGFTSIGAPLGCTGHHGCDAWYVLDLRS